MAHVACTKQQWFSFLDAPGQGMALQSYELLSREERLHSSFDDYSFVVFPMAKAYEGFLKMFLYRLGLISHTMYQSKQFRIGRSLNPDVSGRHRDEQWLYDDIEHVCGKEMARELWETWLDARNHRFHYFPDTKYQLTLSDARVLLDRVCAAMNAALSCTMHHTGINSNNSGERGDV